jgi:FkbM family methyltransferase
MRFTGETLERRIVASLADAPTPSPQVEAAEPAPVDVSVLYSIPDDSRFVRDAYQLILGRPCDITGFVNCRERLATHVPRSAVLQHLVISEEARRGGRKFTGVWCGPGCADNAEDGLFEKLGAAYRRVLARANQSLRHHHVLEYKIDYLLQELETRTESISAAHQAALGALSGKLDAYAGDLRAQQDALKGRLVDAEMLLANKLNACAASADTRLAEASGEIRQETEDLRERQRASAAQLESVAATLHAEVEAVRTRIRPSVVHAGDGVVATEVDGFILGLPAKEWRLAAYHAFRGVLEPGLVLLFRKLVQPGMVVVDAGANIGIYTLYAARLAGERGKVYSFEPTPKTFQILKDNVQVNGFLESGVVVLDRAALSNRCGVAQLAVYAADGGHNTLFPGAEAGGTVEVPTITVDKALSGEARVDVVKIDVEGAEPRVLAGMQTVIKRNPHLRILMEFAPVHLKRAAVDPAAFLDQLAAAGWVMERVDDVTGELRPAERQELVGCFSANLSLRREAAA